MIYTLFWLTLFTGVCCLSAWMDRSRENLIVVAASFGAFIATLWGSYFMTLIGAIIFIILAEWALARTVLYAEYRLAQEYVFVILCSIIFTFLFCISEILGSNLFTIGGDENWYFWISDGLTAIQLSIILAGTDGIYRNIVYFVRWTGIHSVRGRYRI